MEFKLPLKNIRFWKTKVHSGGAIEDVVIDRKDFFEKFFPELIDGETQIACFTIDLPFKKTIQLKIGHHGDDIHIKIYETPQVTNMDTTPNNLLY